jgi:hypothetical protein
MVGQCFLGHFFLGHAVEAIVLFSFFHWSIIDGVPGNESNEKLVAESDRCPLFETLPVLISELFLSSTLFRCVIYHGIHSSMTNIWSVDIAVHHVRVHVLRLVHLLVIHMTHVMTVHVMLMMRRQMIAELHH